MIRARFNSKDCKLTVIQCYAPTNKADEEEDKDTWYEQLQLEVSKLISKVPQHAMLMIIGDISAKVGADNTNCDRAMGKHGCGEINDNGERLVDFPHQNNHKLTWRSPDGTTVNRIDHFIANSK